MDIIGIGGPEFILLLLLGAVVLGPRRVVGLAREIGQGLRQIQNMTKNITKEINKEFDLLDHKEREENRQTMQMSNMESHANENGNAQGQLPEAYKRFREDFPEEGGAESASSTDLQDVSPNQ